MYDLEEECLCYKSTDPHDVHHRCVSRNQLITLLNEEHNHDHRKAEACYNSVRLSSYPVVRDTVPLLFKQHVHCELHCISTPGSPPEDIAHKEDDPGHLSQQSVAYGLKELPSCRGYEYTRNIIDCYSRFAMGGPIKSKSAKDICQVILSCIYKYGTPQTL